MSARIHEMCLAAVITWVATEPAPAQNPSMGQFRHTSQWEKLGSMPGAGPWIQSMAESAADSNRIYASTVDGGLLVSSDAGQSWVLRRMPFDTSSNVAWAWINPSPSDRDVALAGSYAGNLLRTEDAGLTWQTLLEIPGFFPWIRGDFAPSNSSYVYASTADSVLRSLDGGFTYEDVTIPGTPGITDLAVAYDDPLHVYVLESRVAIHETMDGGDTWTSKPAPAGFRVELDPANNQRLLMSYRTKISLSEDGGATWSTFDAYPESVYVDGVSFDPFDSDRMYAWIRQLGVSISSDRGLTWNLSTDSGLRRAGGWGGALSASRATAGLLLVGSSGGVFRSTDSGATFARSNGNLQRSAFVAQVVVDPFDSHHLVAMTGGSIYGSHDSGNTWREGRSTPGFGGHPGGLAADPVVAGRYYAATSGGRLTRSDNGGRTFKTVSTIGSLRARLVQVVPHPTIPDRVFMTARTGSSGLHRSDDAGVTVYPTSGPYGWSWAVAISSVDPNLMFYSVANENVRSEDGGLTWIYSDTPCPPARMIVTHPTDANVAYSLGASTVYRTLDRGQNWSPMSAEFEWTYSGLLMPGDPENLIANNMLAPIAYQSRNPETEVHLLGGPAPSIIYSFASSHQGVLAATFADGVMILR